MSEAGETTAASDSDRIPPLSKVSSRSARSLFTICDAADAAMYAGSGLTGGGDNREDAPDIEGVRSRSLEMLGLRWNCGVGNSRPSGREVRCIFGEDR